MKSLRLFFIFLILSFSLYGCNIDSALPWSFTTENTLKLKIGMNSKEIMKMFGPPKSVSSILHQTTWTYGQTGDGYAFFIFHNESG